MVLKAVRARFAVPSAQGEFDLHFAVIFPFYVAEDEQAEQCDHIGGGHGDAFQQHAVKCPKGDTGGHHEEPEPGQIICRSGFDRFDHLRQKSAGG